MSKPLGVANALGCPHRSLDRNYSDHCCLCFHSVRQRLRLLGDDDCLYHARQRETPVIERISRGVLDHPLVAFAKASAHPALKPRRSLLTRRSPPSDEGGWRRRVAGDDKWDSLRDLVHRHLVGNPAQRHAPASGRFTSKNQNYTLTIPQIGSISVHPEPAGGTFRDRHDTLGTGCDGRCGVR